MSEQVLEFGSGRRRAVLLTCLAIGVAVAGLIWAKWLPYSDRAETVAASGRWPGSSLLAAGSGENPLARAWTFTWTYTLAVWKALVVALVVAACVDVLVPRRWLLRVLSRRTVAGGSAAGALLSLPAMMCTCCTAPLTVTMRRAGVQTSAAVAFWLGNPVLNPAVLVFLALLAPWSWVAVRIVVGVALVLGVSTLVGRWVERRRTADARVPEADRVVSEATDPPPEDDSAVAVRLLRSFARTAVVLVPEYLLVVFLVGLVAAPLSGALGSGGLAAVLIAAVIGTVLVLPTAGEMPILLGLAALGVSSGVLGALLITLPALSLPSAVMVGRALGIRVTMAVAAATVVLGVVAGGLLTLLG